MSDQGELAGRRGRPSDDKNDLDPADRPTGPFPQVARPGPHEESAGADPGAPGWGTAESLGFSADPQSDAAGEPGFSGPEFFSATPADDRFESWSGQPDPEAPEAPPASEFSGPQDVREGSGRPEASTPAVWDDTDDRPHGGSGPENTGPADGPPDGPAGGPPRGSAAGIPEGAEPAQKPVWERSLFDDGGMDSGPGDPRYAPVDMSGPGTPPKPGTPSSGNLRLPDWMNESSDADTPVAGPAGPGGSPGSDGSRGSARSSARDSAGDEGGGSRTVLYAGIGLLVVALLAAAGVFLLRSGGSDSDTGSSGSGDGGAASVTPEPKQVAVSLPPDRPLRRFPGTPSRTVGVIQDKHAGIAYPRFGPPWVLPTKQNRLGQYGWSGQQIVVTERAGGQLWYGQMLSGTLGVGERDAYRGSGTEREAAAAVSKNLLERFYAFEHTAAPFASQALDVDGRKGWLVASALRYRRSGVKATGELVVVAVIDTGRKTPAVLFLAVPNTHQKLWPDVNLLLSKLRVMS